MLARPWRTRISATASTATTTTPSSTLSRSRTSSVAIGASIAVGERVHVAVLDDRLVDDRRQDRRGRLELRNVRGVAGDARGDAEQPADRALDARDRAQEHHQQRGDD